MANAISAVAGLSACAKLLRAKSSMRQFRKSRNGFQKFHANNSNTRLFISIRPVTFSSRRKQFINRYVAAVPKNGCGGATGTFLVSLRSLNLGIVLSRGIAGSLRQQRDCFGGEMCGRRLIFRRIAGFYARSVLSI